MRRFYHEIEKIPQNQDWTPASIAILGFGTESEREPFFTSVKQQLLRAQSSAFYADTPVDLKALTEDFSQQWVLLMDAAAPLVPHTVLSLKAAIATAQASAVIAGEAWMSGKSPAGCCAGSLELLADGFGPGRSNLLIRRDLLRELLQALPPENVSGLQWMRQLAQLLRERQEPVLSLPDLLFLRKELPANLPSFPARPGIKRILAISHEFSLTGAPVVFQQAIEVLRRHGYAVYVISPSDGPMYDTLHENGISVSYHRFLSQREEAFWAQIAASYDAVMVNTIVGHWAVERLQSYGIPIFWWLHEAQALFPAMAPAMPDRISPNVHVYCVSDYALEVCKRLKPAYHPARLIYGLQDLRDTPCQDSPIQKGCRTLFTLVGYLHDLKGQDILLNAISLLPPTLADQCLFLFIGKNSQESTFQLVDAACRQEPDKIQYLAQIPRQKVLSIIQNSDCLICASRDDSMPTVLAEGWMFSTPCICSEHTGTAALIQDSKNGLVYQDDDPKALADCIQKFCALSDAQRTSLGAQGRKTFESVFDLPIFQQNLLDIFSALLSQDAANP